VYWVRSLELAALITQSPAESGENSDAHSQTFSRLGVTTLLAVASLTAPAQAQTTGATERTIPSRIVESNGRFYFCSTGGSCASSANGLAWATTGLRLTVPPWSTTYMSGGNSGRMGPDIVFFNNEYYIYYSFCGCPQPRLPVSLGSIRPRRSIRRRWLQIDGRRDGGQ